MARDEVHKIKKKLYISMTKLSSLISVQRNGGGEYQFNVPFIYF